MAAPRKLKHPGPQTGFIKAAMPETGTWLPPKQGEPGFSEMAEKVLSHDIISNDIETFSRGLGDPKRSALKPHHGEIRLIGLTAAPGVGIQLDLGPDGTPNRYNGELEKAILKKAATKVNLGQNFIFDSTYILDKFGIAIPEVLCTKTLSGIRWAGVRTYSHDILSISRRYGLPDYDKSYGGYTDFGGNIGTNEYHYLYKDTLRNIELADCLIPDIFAENQQEVAVIENAIIPVFADITRNGIPVDESLLGQFIEQYTKILRKITKEIKEEARVNPYSSKQVLEFLEQELSTTPDPNEEDFGYTILSSASTDILIEKLIEFPKQLQSWTWKVTDARSLRVALTFAHKVSDLLYRGKVHPFFNTFSISGTGRVGNKDPNMAAIAKLRKRFEEMGLSALRLIFRSKDKQMYILDLPGAHACIAAEASQDPTLIEALGSAGGIHAYTAMGMLRLSGYNFTAEYIDKTRNNKEDPNQLLCANTRDNAKPTFYMKLNGGKAKRLRVVLLGCDPPIRVPLFATKKSDVGKSAQDFSDAWESTYTGVYAYQQKLCAAANSVGVIFDGVEYGAVYNLVGRRIFVRKFDGEVGLPQACMQQWMSTEADWIKRILLEIFHWGKSNPEYGFESINMQHDEQDSLSYPDEKSTKAVCEALPEIAIGISKKILPKIMAIPAIANFVANSFRKKLKVNTLNDK